MQCVSPPVNSFSTAEIHKNLEISRNMVIFSSLKKSLKLDGGKSVFFFLVYIYILKYLICEKLLFVNTIKVYFLKMVERRET